MKRKISLKGSNFSSVKKASKQKLEIYEFFGGNKKFKLTWLLGFSLIKWIMWHLGEFNVLTNILIWNI